MLITFGGSAVIETKTKRLLRSSIYIVQIGVVYECECVRRGSASISHSSTKRLSIEKSECLRG